MSESASVNTRFGRARGATLPGAIEADIDGPRLDRAGRKFHGERLGYYPAFDHLRFVLSTVVAVTHAGLVIWGAAGNYAVQVFFALSGWLIGGILLGSTRSDLPRFYFNRAARIWIPYFVAIALLMAASLLMRDPITGKWLETFFYDGTFVYNIFGPPQLPAHAAEMPLHATGAHFWSICSEEQFYLISPFLITLLPGKVGRALWFWSMLCVLALTSPYWDFFGSISLGVLASVLRSRFNDWHLRQPAPMVLMLVVVLALAGVSGGFIPYRIAAPISAISVVLLLAREGPYSRLAAFMGGVSYPMYLNHWIGLFAAHYLFEKFGMRNTWQCDVAGVVLGFLVAAPLYVSVDRIVKSNRDRYFSAPRGRTLAVVGLALVAVGLTVGFSLESLSPW